MGGLPASTGRGCKLLRRENTGWATDNASTIFQLSTLHLNHPLQLSSAAPSMCEKGEREREMGGNFLFSMLSC